MRFIILITLCISSTFADELNIFRNFYLSTEISNVHLNSVGLTSESRVKRNVYKRPLEDPNKCIKNCTDARIRLIKDLNDAVPNEDDEYGHRFCKVMETEMECITACPDSLLRNLWLDFDVDRKQCSFGNYDLADLQINLDCVNANMDAVFEKCDPYNCSTHGKNDSINWKLHVSPAPPYVSYNNDNKTENSQAFQAICKYNKCLFSCGESIIRAKCGQKAFDLNMKYNKFQFGGLIKMFKDMDALDGDVNECEGNW